MVRAWILAGAIMAGGAFQGSGPAAPVYTAKYTVQTDNGPAEYNGTTTFVVDAKGGVTGAMKLTVPIGVEGTLSGTIKGGTWTFEYPYSIAEQNCTGTVKGTATVPADRKAISGTATILGGCVQQPLAATFSFTMQEKK
jgi:hypothetical protein